jgi:hypothetical protein
MKSFYCPIWIRITAIFLAIASAVIGSWLGFCLYLLGIAATAMFLYATWLVIKLFSANVLQGTKPVPTMISFFVALSFKLPIFNLLGLWIRNLDFRFQACFLLGLTMVYSWLVGWSIARQKRNPETQLYGSDTADHNPSVKS